MSTRRSRLRVAVAHAVYDALFALACVLALAPWLVRALRDPRQGPWARARLGRLPGPPPPGRPIWVHAVSVGEVKAAGPLLAELAARRPEVPLVLSTTTITGHETARRLYPELYLFHAPLDLSVVVRRVLRRVDPRLIVLMELEVWPAFLRAADEHGVPQVIVNGRVTEGSARGYRRWSWWLPEFDRLALVAAQDAAHAGRIAGLGVPAQRVHVTGNLKHELVQAVPAPRVEALARELNLPPGEAVFVAGSTHDGEDEPVLRAWLEVGGARACRLLLVPRHPERARDIERLAARLGVRLARRSSLAPKGSTAEALLVDTVGELETLFGLADVVFLGGSLVEVGGHNVLEPAAAGRVQLVGPHLANCRAEARLLQEAGGLQVVADGAELARALGELLADPARRRALGGAARRALGALRGAARTDVDLLVEHGLLDDARRVGRLAPIG